MKIVIALGGNALGDNPAEQKELVKVPAEKVALLAKDGHTVVVGHGNGPQVGMIFNAFADAKKVNPKTPHVPFAEAGILVKAIPERDGVAVLRGEIEFIRVFDDEIIAVRL